MLEFRLSTFKCDCYFSALLVPADVSKPFSFRLNLGFCSSAVHCCGGDHNLSRLPVLTGMMLGEMDLESGFALHLEAWRPLSSCMHNCDELNFIFSIVC